MRGSADDGPSWRNGVRTRNDAISAAACWAPFLPERPDHRNRLEFSWGKRPHGRSHLQLAEAVASWQLGAMAM